MKYTTTKVDQLNWLASSRFQAFTELADTEYASGAVFMKNGAVAGLVVNHVVGSTDDPIPASVMVEGYVLPDRLPVALTDAQKTALKAIGIKFRGEAPAPSTAGGSGTTTN
ncbi:hypothetical protein HAU43_00950 [Weissella confusa]|uniref:Phage protein n=1 Tax=Weissella confusa TaxID=1583 RepID=A0AAE2S5P4_WEICO|nr:hypothetical protein [Weissella confusa]MBJ7631684.1 hypothetical protein [Weissella confusa]MBJ7644457.1 hypothetical protein [Weissella confusa]TGE54004.1 hypothetical protein C6P22_03835 [Weissella confusa]